jgi:hypothetical protein
VASARATTRKKRKLRVGDRVSIQRGTRTVRATIIGDRGHIGVGGRRLLRIKHDSSDTSEPAMFEVPEADLSAA